MSKSCSRGPRHCRNAATKKRKLKADQVYLYLPSIKGGIIFSQVLAMEHLLLSRYEVVYSAKISSLRTISSARLRMLFIALTHAN